MLEQIRKIDSWIIDNVFQRICNKVWNYWPISCFTLSKMCLTLNLSLLVMANPKLSMFLFGFFISAEILVFAAINDLCHKEISATAVGFVNMVVMLGGLYLQPKVGMILDYLTYPNELTKFKVALSILPVGLVISAILSMFLKNGIQQTDLED